MKATQTQGATEIDGKLLMGLAVIRELTGTQKTDNIEATIEAVRKAVAPQPAVEWTPPSGMKVADIGFVWDGENQQHIPRLVIHFEPVPANSGVNAKGWQDRDAFVAILTTAPEAPQPAKREPLTTGQIRKWWASENGLEDCDMAKLDDFEKVVRAIEAAHGIGA